MAIKADVGQPKHSTHCLSRCLTDLCGNSLYFRIFRSGHDLAWSNVALIVKDFCSTKGFWIDHNHILGIGLKLACSGGSWGWGILLVDWFCYASFRWFFRLFIHSFFQSVLSFFLSYILCIKYIVNNPPLKAWCRIHGCLYSAVPPASDLTILNARNPNIGSSLKCVASYHALSTNANVIALLWSETFCSIIDKALRIKEISFPAKQCTGL